MRARRRKLINTFTLQCVTCKAKDERECKTVTEQPFCEKCYSPMVVVSVTLNKVVRP